ncbi:serine hydrolase domain-containing protein [Croceitalea rosinachiae]|uniref:Serine hydrolase domain-containing protein n=1 Tax=Croceitalea rosinachiae TaxID=3075596 RepID=A0ABU3ABW8_9FLAO|nr:serine hydrolase domain-containing protein [Croceitalea sp. F388]MDT0607052.1 serine hydrolase domain-containing protein [Croceitalea sp. F388]
MKTLILILTMFPFLLNAQEVSELLQEKLINDTENPVHGMSFLIERDGDVLVNEAVGLRKKNGDTLQVTDQFRIASSTKLFVSTIILQLEEEGKLSLLDTIYPYLKSIEFLKLDEFHWHKNNAFAKAITIKQLLSHKSGLADVFNDRQQVLLERVLKNSQQQYQPKDVVDWYFEFGLHKEAKFKPGEGWHYSDMNYVLLGFLIEKLDKKSLSQSIRDRILNPLDMQDTYFEFYEKTHSKNARIHQYVGATDFNEVNTSFDWSGGGLVSTHQDVATFIKALFNGKLISKESLLKMITIEETFENHLPYGLGVYESVYNDQTFYGHYGFFGTYIGYCPETKTVLSYCITQAMPSFNVYEFVNYVVKFVK